MTSGRCHSCALRTEQQRGTATARGYGRAWTYFKPQFLGALLRAGIVPVCGVALPDGPQTRDSLCQAHGWLTFQNRDGSSLHLDHEPPLTDAERQQSAIVCDPLRIQLLCDVCHGAKTKREAGGD